MIGEMAWQIRYDVMVRDTACKLTWKLFKQSQYDAEISEHWSDLARLTLDMASRAGK